ncbi:hypothetical protein G3M53_74880 [Streptomyces sp. SID7982]|nr:hypothetical protein [Streptomyces sp. SID7982]
MPDIYPPNPCGRRVLADMAGFPVEESPEVRGSVVLFGFDGLNEWDNTRPLTASERGAITEALTAAGCSAS